MHHAPSAASPEQNMGKAAARVWLLQNTCQFWHCDMSGMAAGQAGRQAGQARAQASCGVRARWAGREPVVPVRPCCLASARQASGARQAQARKLVTGN